MKTTFFLVVLAISSVAFAEEPAPETPIPPISPAVQFATACLGQGAAFSATHEFCEGLMVKSRLIQSDALRYLAPLTEKQREKFATSSTSGRFDMVEVGADIPALVRAVLTEVASEGLVTPANGSRVAAAVVADVMKSNCGPYQLDTIMRTVDATSKDRGTNRPRAKVRVTTACLVSGGSQSADAIDDLKKCLNGIFQVTSPKQEAVSVTSVLFPNP